MAAALPGMEADKKPPEDSKSFDILFAVDVASRNDFSVFMFDACVSRLRPVCLFLVPLFFSLVTEIDLNNAPVETKPAEGGCAC